MRNVKKGKQTVKNSCDNKVPHESEEAAIAHARYLGSAMQVYKCRFCEFWHMGHARKW